MKEPCLLEKKSTKRKKFREKILSYQKKLLILQSKIVNGV